VVLLVGDVGVVVELVGSSELEAIVVVRGVVIVEKEVED